MGERRMRSCFTVYRPGPFGAWGQRRFRWTAWELFSSICFAAVTDTRIISRSKSASALPQELVVPWHLWFACIRPV